MFPHTITLYNVESCTDQDTMRTEQINHITVLRGVLVVPTKASTAGKNGYAGADKVTVYIPFSVAAVDGAGEQEKRYASPRDFASAEDKSALWTFTTDEKTFYMEGEAVEPSMTRQQLEKVHEVFSVTSVAERDFGPEDMKHWEIGGA